MHSEASTRDCKRNEIMTSVPAKGPVKILRPEVRYWRCVHSSAHSWACAFREIIHKRERDSAVKLRGSRPDNKKAPNGGGWEGGKDLVRDGGKEGVENVKNNNPLVETKPRNITAAKLPAFGPGELLFADQSFYFPVRVFGQLRLEVDLYT